MQRPTPPSWENHNSGGRSYRKEDLADVTREIEVALRRVPGRCRAHAAGLTQADRMKTTQSAVARLDRKLGRPDRDFPRVH